MAGSSGSQLVRCSGNALLQGLGRADQALLEPHVEEVAVARGTVLFRRDEPLDALYFPGSVMIALEEDARAGAQAEVAIVGREGMLGWPALLGCDRSAHAAVVRMKSGIVLRIAMGPLRKACRRSPTLQPALLRFVDAVIVQMSRAIASHLQDPLDQRLARWLLMRHDRIGGDVLIAQHDEIADSLNVRRASVTDQLHVIEGEKLIRCNRGRILIRDRAGLERFAGDAYGAADAQYRGVIAPFVKSPPERPERQPALAAAPPRHERAYARI